MNVTIENLAPCRKLVRIELDAPEVDQAFKDMEREFQKHASLPGFRPGKAPLDRVLKKYEQDIRTEVKRKLIPDSYRKAVEEHKLDVITQPDIEEIQFGRGQALQFAATVETAPDFPLPEYKGLPARLEKQSVTDEDVEKATRLLRERQMKYNTVHRPAQTGDITVVNYTGSCDGKPITDTAPTARGLTEQKNFWIDLEKDSFIPGFGAQLLGCSVGEKRTVTIDFPADFVTPQLAGKKGEFAVEVLEVKEKVLPELNEEFAKNYGAESLEKLREGVRKDLENELKYKEDRVVRNQILGALLSRVQFELPESSVQATTRNLVYDIVRENQQRGVTRETIEQNKDQIFGAANTSAKDRVKLQFLIQKIAEKEDIKVSEQEVLARIYTMAAMNQIPAEQFLKDLKKRNAVIEVYDQVASEKVVKFLQDNAAIEEVPLGTLSKPQ